ncbi:MAG: AAA family ATPase [Acidobacteriota bacterium]|nr:AAA family ATPase [Acidobacteriota bacterium]
MLSSFTIRNFKSYEKATLKLGPLTVLVGANASGKSNAVEALRFLSWFAQGNKLGSIRYALQESAQAIRGTVNDLGHGGRRRFSLSCVTKDPKWNQYSVTLERQTDEDLHITDERLTGSFQRVPLFEVVSSQVAGGDIRVAYNNFARGGMKPQVTCTDQMAVLLQLQSSARFGQHQKMAQRVIPETTTRYQGWLSNIVFLDPQPSTMRAYSFKTERTLSGHGANLSGVLFNLCRKAHTKSEVLHFIKALPEQDITKIDFIETPRNEAMVKLTETFGGKQTEYDAALLSDGTLRVLGIAAAVLSAPEGSIVVIEEIDNGVHPSRAKLMLDRLSTVANERNLRVLISSHNPALLDALPDDAVPNVVFCYRDPTTGSSCLQRLVDLPDYPELIAQGAVGHLLTQGILERVVKFRRRPEERRRRAHAWLEAIKKQAG